MLCKLLGPFCNMPCRNSRVHLYSLSFGPDAIKLSSVPNCGTSAQNLRNSTEYSVAVMSPPHPHDSLPTPQNRTLKGSLLPPAARRSASVVLPAGELQYSTHW